MPILLWSVSLFSLLFFYKILFDHKRMCAIENIRLNGFWILELMDEPALNTWEMVFMIFGGTMIFCLVVLSSYWYFQKRKRDSSGQSYANDDSVCDPILNGNTLQDIIEMTTSGSGSGKFGIYLCRNCYVKWKFLGYFIRFSFIYANANT